MNWHRIFAAAVSTRASDIHLQEGRCLFLRAAGDLYSWGNMVLDADEIRRLLLKIGWSFFIRIFASTDSLSIAG